MAEILPADPSSEALQTALAEARKATHMGWGLTGIAASVAIGIASWIASASDTHTNWVIGVLVAGAFAVALTAGWVRKRHESDIMPILADAFGLQYDKSPTSYFDSLPTNFIPRGGERTCDDKMSGSIGGRGYQFVEVKTETGGEDSSILFDGVVVELRTRQTLPRFLIAPVAETTGFLFFNPRVGVENKVQHVTMPGPNGKDYGLWVDAQDDATGLYPFMDKMLAIGGSLGGSTLYSVAFTGAMIYVAIRHRAEMFRIGGLLATQANIMDDIRRASQQFAIPVQLVTDVMRAEDALIVAMGGTARQA